MGGLPAVGLVRLVVEEQDYAPARAAIDRWEAAESELSAVPAQAPRYRGLHGFVLGLLLGMGRPVRGLQDARDDRRHRLQPRRPALDETWTYAANGSR
jgi:hypothetical protein